MSPPKHGASGLPVSPKRPILIGRVGESERIPELFNTLNVARTDMKVSRERPVLTGREGESERETGGLDTRNAERAV